MPIKYQTYKSLRSNHSKHDECTDKQQEKLQTTSKITPSHIEEHIIFLCNSNLLYTALARYLIGLDAESIFSSRRHTATRQRVRLRPTLLLRLWLSVCLSQPSNETTFNVVKLRSRSFKVNIKTIRKFHIVIKTKYIVYDCKTEQIRKTSYSGDFLFVSAI